MVESKQGKRKSTTRAMRRCKLCGVGELTAPFMHDHCMEEQKRKIVHGVYVKFKRCVEVDCGMSSLYDYIRRTLKSDKLDLVSKALTDARNEELCTVENYLTDVAEKAVKEIRNAKDIVIIAVSNNTVYQYRKWYGRWYRDEVRISAENIGHLMNQNCRAIKLCLGDAKQILDWECTKAGYHKMDRVFGYVDILGYLMEYNIIEYAQTNVSELLDSGEINCDYCEEAYRFLTALLPSERRTAEA